MTDPQNTFTTVAGRIVGGSLSKPQTTDYDGNSQSPRWTVMLAIPKAEAQPLINQIKAAATAGFAATPALLSRADFAWKWIDGDSTAVNKKNVAYNSKEGYPGHFVFAFSTTFAFETVGQDLNLLDPASVLTGHWVKVFGDMKANGKQDNPGIYLNLKAVQFVRTDNEIMTGGAVRGADVFGGPAEAHDIVDNAIAPPPPPPSTPPPPPQAPGLQLTAKGLVEGIDPAAYLTAAQPWTEDQLRKAGWIV